LPRSFLNVRAISGVGCNQDHLSGTIPNWPRLSEWFDVSDQNRRIHYGARIVSARRLGRNSFDNSLPIGHGKK